MIDETECLHLVASGVKISESISRLSVVNVVLLVLRPQGVGLAPAHVSSRYHQLLRNRLICKGTVVPINGAKLMVLFLSKLGWSSLESLGRSSGRIDIQPAHKGWSGGGASTASWMPKSVSFLRKGKRSTIDGSVIVYLSMVELFGSYHG